MNTVATPQTRRRTISGYEKILKTREDREAQELVAKEEQQRLSHVNMVLASQQHINALCQVIQERYTAMVNAGKNMKTLEGKKPNLEKESEEKLKEEDLFHDTADVLYPLKEIDESAERKMAIRRMAYYGLPVLDSIFAFLALSPILISKIGNSSSFLAGFAEPAGIIASLVLGYGMSLLSRLAVSTMSENDSPAMRALKWVATGGAMMCLPLMYILGELYFNGGHSWPYTICFAIISLVIQLLIVSGFKQQMEALYYFRMKEQNKATEAAKQADADAIRKEMDDIRKKDEINNRDKDNIKSSFERDYASFTQNFRDLAAARDEHILKFGEDVKLYLNQLVIYVGNLFCFRRQVIPLYLTEDGSIDTMPYIDFPNVNGAGEIYVSDDFLNIQYMRSGSWLDSSLAETNRIIENHQASALNTPQPSDVAQPESASSSASQDATDMSSATANDNPQDEPDSGGGIW